MPRNEFVNHFYDLEGKSDLEIQDLLTAGEITVNDVRAHRGLPTVPLREGEEEVPNQEDGTVESRPEPPTLAELRKSGRFTTEALQRRTAT